MSFGFVVSASRLWMQCDNNNNTDYNSHNNNNTHFYYYVNSEGRSDYFSVQNILQGSYNWKGVLHLDTW